jgi:hypothetical protein
VPGPAFKVNAEWPSGAPWSYYVIPVLSTAGQVIAFVQLAADDGSFEAVNVLAKPARFAPLTLREAERLARRTLARDERLTGGVLTWSARGNVPVARSPVRPYYEFGIASASRPDAHIGRVWVTLTDEAVLRGRPVKLPSVKP